MLSKLFKDDMIERPIGKQVVGYRCLSCDESTGSALFVKKGSLAEKFEISAIQFHEMTEHLIEAKDHTEINVSNFVQRKLRI
ncbi:MAG: hypothetical protein MRY79_03155 [Alphaproteobacteria bacterium]|nr:hypothetical protein [Alphaproteobacteria bacterium]